ncbi:MAG TPA: GerMN domain-containing protein [Spirochaetia bacterium]|nr:GerMN domain-containing protein [Spirochaetia bacterium]
MAATRTSRKKAQASNRRTLGCLFWVCLVLVIAAVGYAARVPLQDAFGRLVSTLGGKHGGPVTPPQVTVSPISQPQGQTAPATNPPRPTKQAPIPSGQSPGTAPANPPAQKTQSGPGQQPTQPAQGGQPAQQPPQQAPGAQPAQQAPVTQQKAQARKARLYFVAVDPSGKLFLKSVVRSIPASDSPLRDTLDALLGGPTGQELNLGLLSMIPAGSRLLSATVKGDTAYLDFSESFRFNDMGLDGMNAQLRQIVYAATEFPTVKSVQLLIGGKRVTYLGTEGARIDKPLTRDSLQPDSP